MRCVLAFLALATLCLAGGDLKLRKLVVLNRHGHRAPNAPFWKLCPTERKDGNRKRFGVGDEDLTSVGFDEERRAGNALREEYGHFIGNTFTREDVFVQAVGEPRTLQSVNAICSSLFRPGYGPPSQFRPHQPQFVPAFSDNLRDEFFIDNVVCKEFTKKHITKWLAANADNILDEPENKALMKKLTRVCHTPARFERKMSADRFVKLLVDGVIFEHDFGMKELDGKLTDKEFFQLRNLSNVFLQGKLYSTDEQKTTSAGEFPNFLVRTLKSLEGKKVPNINRDNEPMAFAARVNLFDCHREEVYGLGYFFGYKYDCPDMAPMEVPAGTSVIFEYLEDKHGKFFIRPRLWNPREGYSALKFPGCKDHELCTGEEFTNLYEERVKRTGTWDKLCDWTPRSA